MTGWRWLGAGIALLVGSFGLALVDFLPSILRALLVLPGMLYALYLMGAGLLRISMDRADRQEFKVRSRWTTEEWALYRSSPRGRREAQYAAEAAIRARGDVLRRRADELGVTVTDVEAMDIEAMDRVQRTPLPSTPTPEERFTWDGSEISRTALTSVLHGRPVWGSAVRVTMPTSVQGPVHVWTPLAKFLLLPGSTLVVPSRDDSTAWSVVPPPA